MGVTAEEMVDMVAVTMVKDLPNQDMAMVAIVDVLFHMVDMVVDVDMVGMVDMVEVTMERGRLDMVAMEGVMVEVMVEVMEEDMEDMEEDMVEDTGADLSSQLDPQAF